MNNDQDFLYLPGIDMAELNYLRQLTANMTDEQRRSFSMIYNGRRRDPQTILLLTLVGFLGIAGVQRFYVNDIGMGILYFLTAGLCGIGTIIDLINHKKLALEYNLKQAQECAMFMGNSAAPRV